ncbi:MAG: DNA polymerase III subunit alpha [Coriobacteriales bacterium]|jgi:DNA polymerase-3 subunit alpha|nr:DNA polymerase III subunit alpha [Coriobacteriales bacterium]
MAFVHLHNHSEYSLLDGATKVKAMAARAKELEMPAIALTDHGYMYGIPAFYEACTEAGIKPILGCEVYFTPDDQLRRDKRYPELYHLVLLAKNNVGYHNLIKIVSRAAVEGFYYKPRVTLEWLSTYSEGLIASSACMAGIIPSKLMRNQPDEARQWAERFAGIYAPGDFYIELQDQGIVIRADEISKSVDLQEQDVRLQKDVSQHELNGRLSQLAGELGLKTVGTNDLHYLLREDAQTQDMMLCIGMGKKFDDEERMRFSSDQFYLKTEAEMRQALKEFPEACDTTVEIAEKCEAALEKKIILPTIPLPAGETNESKLRTESEEGLKHLYGDPLPSEVVERFEFEYKIICEQGFPAYFLVVQEFVRWAKQNGIGVGPGRGSAAGSIISYALNITTLDPLANGLLFERFLSPERTEMPDIDIDFDEEGRFRVIEHLRELYGPEKVAHVITYGSMKAKQAINDAARVFDYPVFIGQNISKMVSGRPNTSLKGTLGIHEKAERNQEETNPDLVKQYRENPDTKKIVDAALALEGTIRGEGVHASAVIICRDPVDDHVPVKLDTKGGVNITQYDGSNCAELGLLKMDFLGLRTLNVLMKACEYVQTNHGVTIDLDSIPLDNPEAFELMGGGNMAGLFQVEGPLYVRLFARMKPNQFSDIVASIALNRPGPLESGMLDDFVARKTGKRKVAYYDDRLADILEETYGALVYQEQVMLISMKMSGFTAGESDLVRKAMAKKKIKLMKVDVTHWADGTDETMEDHWLNGAERNGYSRKVAKTIWEDVEKFAAYAFNKSHSAAYAILVMQTAWIKAHYPLEFMAAVLSSFVGKSDRLTQYIQACKQSGIDVLPPDVNSSGGEFTPTPDGIRFGLAGINGVGEGAAEQIITERERGGRFTSLHDFVYRVNNTLCNKKTVEALVKSGAFDSTGYTRRQLYRFISADALMEKAAKRHQDKAMGQESLFGLFEEAGLDSGFEEDVPKPDGIEWSQPEKLGFEKEALKLYVSGHPLSPYTHLLERHRDYSLGVFMGHEIEGAEDDDAADATVNKVPEKTTITLAGMVSGLTGMFSKKNDRMAKFTLEDMEGSIDAIIFPQNYARYGAHLTDEAKVAVRCRYESNDRGQQILVSEVYPLVLEKEQDARPAVVELHVPTERFNQRTSDDLNRLLRACPGSDPVVLFLKQSGNQHFRAELPLTVDATSTILRDGLVTLFGREALAIAQ